MVVRLKKRKKGENIGQEEECTKGYSWRANLHWGCEPKTCG